MSVITAKYIRLSSEDDDLGKSGKVESNSVTNQRNLLDAFISRTPELADTSVIEFCDDGWSGKNFERPAVQEMIAQARAGKIQCIVVKDLSRFVKILRDERYFGKNIFGKRIRDRVGHTHTVKVSREDWIAVENTHEGIVTREEFDRAQTAMREFVEHGELKKRDWPLRGKVRCGVCGHAMSYKLGKQMYFYCYTPRYNDSFACVKQVQGADILEVISDGLRVQAQMAVELSRLWEEQHREQKKDAAAVKKNLAGLRETHQRLSQQISGLYESFALGEIGKPEYLAAKTAAAKQRDDTAARISELEAALENMGADGSLRNGFVSTFGKYLDVKEITSEITAEVLKEVLVFPGDRFEIAWNYRDELEKLILDLQGEHQNGA